MSADETKWSSCGLKFPFTAFIFVKYADVLNYLQNLLPFSCYVQRVGSLSEIFDHFLDLMQTYSAHVDIESQRFQGYYQVKLTLWKCGSCAHPLFSTFFTVRESCDLGHRAQYLDIIQDKWRLYSTEEDSS